MDIQVGISNNFEVVTLNNRVQSINITITAIIIKVCLELIFLVILVVLH